MQDQWACILVQETSILSSGQWVLWPLNDYLTPHLLLVLLAILLSSPQGSKQLSDLVQFRRAAHKAVIPLPPYRVSYLLGINLFFILNIPV